MPKKRILLLYITEISGHHSASIALENALKRVSFDLEILNINAFRYTNPIAEKIANKLYMAVIKKAPKIWDYLYDNANVLRKINSIKENVHSMNSPKLAKLFNTFKPDIIACTQAYPCGMVADYKKINQFAVPLVAVLTDYVPHSYWIYDTINTYIVPSDEVKQRMVRKGVSADKIKTFGIPFDPKFNDPIDRNKVRQSLGLDLRAPTLLIMGGGHGLGPMDKVLKELDNVDKNFQGIVVTGSNKKLYESLKRKIGLLKKKIVLFGYADNVNELMSISDIIITKPGGITTSEALAKKLPMLILNPLPGQEANNTAYLTQQNAAIKVLSGNDIKSTVEDLLAHPDKLKMLSANAARISKPNASFDIANFLLNFNS
jgi:processive 1,2-diacylglycerol beta-glucosyltransferase